MASQHLFRIADRWRNGKTPTESEITEVYSAFPEMIDNLASYMNALANIADTNISAKGLRHMAARSLGRPLPKTEKAQKQEKPEGVECVVPYLDGKPLVNAVGSNETECHANLGLLDLTDQELNRVELIVGTLVS